MNKLTAILGFSLLLVSPALLWAAGAQDYKEGGMALFRAGQYEKALAYFKNAVQADPNDAEAYQDLGNTYVKMNDSANARDAYQKSLQINPNNTNVQSSLDNLGGSSAANPPPSAPAHLEDSNSNPPAQTQSNQVENDQPIQDQTRVVVRRRRAWTRPAPVDYKDGLAPMDHAKLWLKGEMFYNYSLQTDLINSADSINNGTFVPSGAVSGSASYTGSSIANNSGLGWGGELGFLVNPNFGVGIGVRAIQTGDYTADVSYDTGDSEHLTLTPQVVPITLDLYLFMPDGGGRFFLSGGVGYYAGVVHVDQTTTTNNFFSTPNGSGTTDNWSGDLYSGNIGFQLGIGRDFAVSRGLSIEVFARGRYAKITNFRGTLYEANNGGNQAYVLAASSTGPTIVDADLPEFVTSANNERYATIDFTGFDVGLALTLFAY